MNFIEICSQEHLPLKFEHKQLMAWLAGENDQFLHRKTLQQHKHGVDLMIKLTKSQPIAEISMLFSQEVLPKSKPKMDDKLPVTDMLVTQLIAACDVVFTGYTKTLFKATLALAWVCYLRTSEYTEARPG